MTNPLAHCKNKLHLQVGNLGKCIIFKSHHDSAIAGKLTGLEFILYMYIHVGYLYNNHVLWMGSAADMYGHTWKQSSARCRGCFLWIINHYVLVAINDEFRCVFFVILTSELLPFVAKRGTIQGIQTASISSCPCIPRYQTAYSKLHVCILNVIKTFRQLSRFAKNISTQTNKYFAQFGARRWYGPTTIHWGCCSAHMLWLHVEWTLIIIFTISIAYINGT